jgi:fluoride exporter
MTFLHMVLVGVGGFLGAISRFSVSRWINSRFLARIPVATLVINLTGSFLLGLILGSSMNKLGLLLLGTGFMGAFTTFSTFKLEGIRLFSEGKRREFYLYNGLSYGLGILLAFLGFMIGQYISKKF